MKLSLFYPEYTKGLFTILGTRHTNIPANLGD